MHIRETLVGVLVAVLLAAACPAAEENAGVGYGAATVFLSKYVTRGSVVSDRAVVQPEAWVTYGAFTLDVWNNVDLTDAEVAPWRVTETDWAIQYDFALWKANLSLGYLYYTFPNLHVDDTQEIFGSVEFDVPLCPSLAVYYDTDEIGGAYANAAITYPLALGFESGGEGVSAEFGASIGYGDSNYIGGCFEDVGAGFVDLVLSCQVPLQLSGRVTLTPAIYYMQVIDSDLRKCTDKSEALYGGASLEVDF